MSTIQISISNVHADAVGSYLTGQGRSWRIVESTGDHVEDVATCETNASRDEIQAAMSHSVDVRGDRCSAIEWLDTAGTAGRDPLLGFSPDEIVVGPNGQTLAQAAAAATVRVRRLGHDLEHDVHDPARDAVSPEMASLDAALDWIAGESGVTREHLVLHGSEIWVLGACAALGIIERGPALRRLGDEIAPPI